MKLSQEELKEPVNISHFFNVQFSIKSITITAEYGDEITIYKRGSIMHGDKIIQVPTNEHFIYIGDALKILDKNDYL